MNSLNESLLTEGVAAPRQANANKIPGDRLIPLCDVIAKTGMGKTAIYERVKARSFPLPVKLGSSSRWLLSEVDAFIASAAAQRSAA